MRAIELLNHFKSKKVLITGNTGFKGSWLTALLLHADCHVVGYALPPETDPGLYNLLNLKDRITQYLADIRDFARLQEIVCQEQPDIVFHLAAQPLVRRSYADPIRTFEVNTLGTAYLLEALKKVKSVRAAVIATTDKVYDNQGDGRHFREEDPLGGADPYSASKACAEIVSKSYIHSYFRPECSNCRVATVRAGNVIGGGDWSQDRLVPDIVRAVYVSRQDIVLRRPHAIRPWQHVLDPLVGYLRVAKALQEDPLGMVGAWNFAPSVENCVSVEMLVQRGLVSLNSSLSYRIAPDLESPEVDRLHLNASKAERHLGWHPRLSLSRMLEWTFGWYRIFYETGEAQRQTEQQIQAYLLDQGLQD